MTTDLLNAFTNTFFPYFLVLLLHVHLNTVKSHSFKYSGISKVFEPK